ncbi:hypothetical protein RRG08_007495 [Elysia crispata]|uniref:Uncharacterized protein n=1 Tax=Elysia crispata TaxID=231223 RepID=A0AAE1DPH4_9GAST|nr:hypothetical protein RRG08_007495 [Elysia crispata]
MHAPENLTSSTSPPHHTIESRPSPTSSLVAGQTLEGTGGPGSIKTAGSHRRGESDVPPPDSGDDQEQHDARIVAAFRCRRCGYATTTLHAGNRHLSRSCTGVRALEEAPQEDSRAAGDAPPDHRSPEGPTGRRRNAEHGRGGGP